MSDQIHTYHHTFSDGSKIGLTVDYSGTEVIMKMVGCCLIHCDAEYRRWRDTVVLPDVFNRMTPEQARAAAELGRKAREGL